MHSPSKNLTFTSILEEELAEIREKNLYRAVRTLVPTGATHASWQGKDLLLFCGNDYLGLSRHPRVVRAAKNVLETHGVGSGAARLISGTSDWHTALEDKLAGFKKKEKALLFTTGYTANVGVLTALAGPKDLIVMDKLCHASLIDGAKLSGATLRVFPHKNYKRCEEILEKGTAFKKRLLVSESVFSMDGDTADLEALIRLKEKFECVFLVDDAHGTGVLGLEGRGAAEDAGLEDKIDVIVGTLSKAVGVLGGFAATSHVIHDYLINFSRPFIFATSLPPVLCAAAHKALDVIEEEPAIRHRLWQNVQKLHDFLDQSGFHLRQITSPIIPIIVGDEKEALRLSDILLKEGILVPAIRYPTVPKGQARLRVTVSAAHQDKDLECLAVNLSKRSKA